ncbi:MAG: hypothetical protein IJZ68_07920 [Bacteroidaceae bacterium]|nr:hypothetical protein [Bacteroidaceae bacterium]
MYTINTQDVIFDAAAAKAEIETKSKQIPIENKEALRFNRILCFFMWVLAAVLALLTFWLFGPDGILYHERLYHIFMMVGLGITIIIPLWIYNDNSKAFLYSWEWYGLNAEYSQLVQDKTVLKHEVKYSDTFNRKILYLTLEDANHVVSTEIISNQKLKFVTRTDINRPKLDLPKETVYLPYEG